PYNWKCYHIPPSYSVSLNEGKTKTNAEGKFEIPLHLLTDESIGKKNDPLFTYTIEVTIVDENGEVKNLNKTIAAAYQSSFVQIQAQDVVNNSSDSLRIS